VIVVGPPALTESVAVSVLPAFVPVTVCVPGVVAWHVLAEQDPLGVIANVVELVTSPRLLLNTSKAVAV